MPFFAEAGPILKGFRRLRQTSGKKSIRNLEMRPSWRRGNIVNDRQSKSQPLVFFKVVGEFLVKVFQYRERINQIVSRVEEAEKLYAALGERDVEAVLDDRDERAGVKFKDADLIGFPYQVIVGPKSLKEGMIELKSRRTGERELLPKEGAAEAIAERIFREIEELGR